MAANGAARSAGAPGKSGACTKRDEASLMALHITYCSLGGRDFRSKVSKSADASLS